MSIIFFIYGLSFFFLGITILFQVRKGSDFKIGKHLWLLATFGLLHGLNEWLDMFLLMQAGAWTATEMQLLEVVRFLIGKISYIFLLQFGVILLCERSRHVWLPKVSLGLSSALVALLFIQGYSSGFSEKWLLLGDISTRYLLAFPSALLTALAIFKERSDPEIKRLDVLSVHRGLTGLAVSFVLYAILAGLIVKPAAFFPASAINYVTFMDITGLPVQCFRAGCAIAMVVFLCRVLNIFEIETKHKLDNAYREIIRISNREQLRIGQDLHDDLGQQLMGIAYMGKALEEKLRTKSVEEASGILSQVRTLLDRSILTTRTLSRGLYPVSIESKGLGFALQELGENTETIFGVLCPVNLDEAVEIDSGETAIQLYRIAQEAVSNAIKHGHSTEIQINMGLYEGSVILSVSDDGVGIPEDLQGRSGMGLRIMQYRAGVLGAQLDVGRSPDGGTIVACVLKELGE